MTNGSRKKEVQGPKRTGTQLRTCLEVKVNSDAVKSKYRVRTWDVTSVNQGEPDGSRQEMARLDVNISGVSELKWMGWVNLIQMTIISTTNVGKNPIEKRE